LTPLILYSTNSELAFQIAEKYYASRHYVWCTPCFTSGSECMVPPSSEPMKLATRLFEDIKGRDHHSLSIDRLRSGIKNGAIAKHRSGVISRSQLATIKELVEGADLRAFMPLLFVIPYELVARIAKPVRGPIKANYSSIEYLIESLPRKHFDVIRIYGS
jgi:hypothetical protein